MRLKKRFTFIVAMLMLVSLVSGCSNAEWGFYNLSQESNNLETYGVTGEMGVVLDYISPMVGEDEETIAKVQSILNQYSLTFDSKVDTKASKLIFTYYFKNKHTGEQKEILNLQSDGNTLYVRLDNLLNFIKSFGNEEINTQINQIFANVQYLSIDKEELKELLTKVYNDEALAEQMTQVYFNFGMFKAQNIAFQDMFKGLMENVYDEYETGVVKEDKNKYTISLTPEGAVNVFASLANYSIDHIDELASYVKDPVNNLGAAEKEFLSLYNLDFDNFNQEIDTMVDDVKVNAEEYKASIDIMAAYTNHPELKKIWEGTNIEYSLEKTKNNAYITDLNGAINFRDTTTGAYMIKGSFAIKQTMEEIDSVSVSAPTGNILTMTELMKIIEALDQAYVDEPKVLKVDLDNGNYISTFDSGVVNVKVIDSTSYLPLREVGNLLGETINWDNQKKQPYVEQNESIIYLQAVLIDGTSYIPSREFEKIGYKVDWNSEYNVVTFQ